MGVHMGVHDVSLGSSYSPTPSSARSRGTTGTYGSRAGSSMGNSDLSRVRLFGDSFFADADYDDSVVVKNGGIRLSSHSRDSAGSGTRTRRSAKAGGASAEAGTGTGTTRRAATASRRDEDEDEETEAAEAIKAAAAAAEKAETAEAARLSLEEIHEELRGSLSQMEQLGKKRPSTRPSAARSTANGISRITHALDMGIELFTSEYTPPPSLPLHLPSSASSYDSHGGPSRPEIDNDVSSDGAAAPSYRSKNRGKDIVQHA